MASPLEPKPGFDWTRVRWTGPWAPVDDTCSYCGRWIPEDSAYIPLRMWNATHWAAVFCDQCMQTWWGMETYLDEESTDYGADGIDDDNDPPDAGPCCVCEGAGARNILMLSQKSPTPGRGWGCVACDLPFDGALAVVCDGCLEQLERQPLKFACVGYPSVDGRIPIGALMGIHEHDLTRHPEVQLAGEWGRETDEDEETL